MNFWDTFRPRGTGPKYLQICEALAEGIESGRLGPGRKLPSHRMLASKLGLSVGTVTRAYETALDRGLITGEVGRGSYVRHRAHPLSVVDSDRYAPLAADLYQNFPARVPEIENAAWESALEYLIRETDVGALTRASWSEVTRRHQRAGATWIERTGLKADPRNILDCPGVPAVLGAVIGAVTQPGDRIAAATLTHPAVRELAVHHGLKRVAIPSDDQGLIVEELDAAFGAERPRLLYCAPTIHSPTTATMTEKRRREVAEVARRHDVLILEDETAAFLLAAPPLPIAAHAPERSFFVGDPWMALALGLRTVYLLVPEAWKECVARTIASTSGVTPGLIAEVAALWIESGTADRLIEARRNEIEARNALAAELLEGLPVRGHPSGHHLWLELPEGWTAEMFVAGAEREGVALSGADWFHFGHGATPRGVRICLGTPAGHDELRQALERIRGLVERGPE